MMKIKDNVDAIVEIMKHDGFTLEELEAIKKTGEGLASVTQRVIDKALVGKE